MVAPGGADNARPGEANTSCRLRHCLHLFALFIHQHRLHARQGQGGIARLGRRNACQLVIIMPPVSVCHQVSTIGQRPLPMCLSNQCQASSLIGSPTEPSTRRLLRSLPCKGSSAKAHQAADSRRRSVKDRCPVPVYNIPEAPCIRPGRNAFKHQRGAARAQRAVDDIGMPGDPADIRRAEMDSSGSHLEYIHKSVGGPDHVAAAGMHHALWLAGRAVVYRINSGSSASISSAGQSGLPIVSTFLISSSHHTSRPLIMLTGICVRVSTITRFTNGHCTSASSITLFSGISLLPR